MEEDSGTIIWINNELCQALMSGKGMDCKGLKSRRGFVVYVARTYPSSPPTLRVYITPWRPGGQLTMRRTGNIP
eukprot:14513069-Ditylum_brightwellii.AAC.1